MHRRSSVHYDRSRQLIMNPQEMLFRFGVYLLASLNRVYATSSITAIHVYLWVSSNNRVRKVQDHKETQSDINKSTSI